MRITLSDTTWDKCDVDIVALAIPAAKTKFSKALARIESVMGKGVVKQLAIDERFEGKASQVLKIAGRGRMQARWVLLVGAGNGKDGRKVAWRLGHALARAARAQRTGALELPEATDETVRAAARGVVGGNYRFTEYKTDKEESSAGLRSALILTDATKTRSLTAAIRAGQVIAESTSFARDLVNRPPNDLNPITLARAAASESRRLNLPCRVWNKARIEKEGMNLFLAVNKGSAFEPRLIHVIHKPSQPKKRVAFVGKGLTFDAGGLCLKTGKSMVDMKCDMAGAATTLGIVFAAARLKLPIEVHGVVGATENMTGAKAYRPGDIYTSLQGKTVEIINTDAEGRLVLADVLTWVARRIKPDHIIDHATLTGACIVALGPWRAGLYSDDETMATGYLDAADAEGESFWRLPLDSELRSSLNSSVADLKHVGGAYGGSITAALFLREFVGDLPWLHLDIAGPAFAERAHGPLPKGGTGFGVATGVRFLEGLVAQSKSKKTRAEAG